MATFNLRVVENFTNFEIKLDELITLIKEDILKFMVSFKYLELKYYDKILDVCDTSEKKSNNSDRYRRIITKCKFITTTYHSQFEKNGKV